MCETCHLISVNKEFYHNTQIRISGIEKLNNIINEGVTKDWSLSPTLINTKVNNNKVSVCKFL